MALKAIPSVVQLPGGYRLRGFPFKIVERDDNGKAKTFELLPEGSKADFTFYADEKQLKGV